MKTIKEMLPLIIEVFKDFRVIAALVGFIFIVAIARGVANYTKRPPRRKKKKSQSKSVPETPKTKDENEEPNEEEI
ncbi:MAG: hypothetical protein HUK25_07245 [Treponema sp.]|nr:hypothetical protein [Treponema sp.]